MLVIGSLPVTSIFIHTLIMKQKSLSHWHSVYTNFPKCPQVSEKSHLSFKMLLLTDHTCPNRTIQIPAPKPLFFGLLFGTSGILTLQFLMLDKPLVIFRLLGRVARTNERELCFRNTFLSRTPFVCPLLISQKDPNPSGLESNRY